MLIVHNKLSIALILLILVLITGASISVLALPSTATVLTTVVSQVSSSANDAEESLNSGNVSITSPDLQLGAANNTAQLVGIRFTNITIPHNAVIVNAYMEFEVGVTGSTSTSITIQGQAIDNAPAFTSAKNNISARPRTIAQVAWNNIPAWPILNAKWETPNISVIIQEVVNRPKWVNGNSIVILINGSGQRTAKSYDGAHAGAPKLIINFMTPTPPVTLTTTDTPTPIGTPTSFPPGSTHFAVIGDYGTAGQSELDVANLVKSWYPEFVITTGDNNYPDGAASTIDTNIGQYYQEFIYPYVGSYGPGATTNRFFPTLGNHDWYTTNAQPYLNYFSLPGNERYYDLVWGSVHLFVIDSDPSEPDGNSSVSAQAQWLQAHLAASTSPWNLVFMHHPPYSSGSVHGSTTVMQWPYQLWGASAVFAGHDHLYERIFHGGIPYFVNGLGGTSRYGIGTPVAGSQIRYDADYGAMSVTVTDSQIAFQFIARTGAIIDTYILNKSSQISGVAGAGGAVLRYTDGTLKTVTADGSGNYSITVPLGWSGTVTPYKSGYTFTPVSKTYGNVQSSLTGQDYVTTACVSCADIQSWIGGGQVGAYTLGASQSGVDTYPLSNGPVEVKSTNSVPVIAAERVIFAVNGTSTSYSELMGLPKTQLATSYLFPWYNNLQLNSQLRFGNVGSTSTIVSIKIHGTTQATTYTLAPGESQVASFGVSDGPVEVFSDGQNIIAAERVIFAVNNTSTSYSELMGLPKTQATTSYLFPWYNNQQLNSQLRFGNVGSASTIVSVKIHGVTQATTYTLAPGESQVASFGVSDGPVEVFSDGQNIIAAERVIFSVNNTSTSYSELMGLPQTQLATSYLFPWYNNLQLNSQLRFGNVGSASTIVSIKIHGVTQATTYTLAPGESTTVTFPVSDGPVEVFSDGQNIIAAERVIFAMNNISTSYSELMGLPQTQLATSYLFPWYNNQQLNSQLRFAVP